MTFVSNEAARLSSSLPSKHHYSAIHNDDGVDDELAGKNKLKSKFETVYEWVASLWAKSKWFIIGMVLLLFISIERVSFKVLADQMLENYMALLIGSLFCAVILQSFLLMWKQTMKIEDHSLNSTSFPHKRIIGVAIIDCFVLLGFIFAARHLQGVYSVLFFQCNLIGVVILSRFIFPDRQFNNVHWRGVTLLSVAVSLVLLYIVYEDLTLRRSTPNILYAIIFICCSFLQSLSILLKQKILVEWCVPLDSTYFNLTLFGYQLVMAIILSLLCYSTKALLFGGKMEFVVDLMSGVKQLLGSSEAVTNEKYNICKPWILVIYAIASFGVVNSFEFCSNLSNVVVTKVTEAGVVIAFISLLWYQIQSFSWLSIVFHIAIVCMIVIGLEIYNKSSEPDTEMKICLPPSPTEELDTESSV